MVPVELPLDNHIHFLQQCKRHRQLDWELLLLKVDFTSMAGQQAVFQIIQPVLRQSLVTAGVRLLKVQEVIVIMQYIEGTGFSILLLTQVIQDIHTIIITYPLTRVIVIHLRQIVDMFLKVGLPAVLRQQHLAVAFH